jgi:spore germination cell wall hydrolase CwlJ-like protein
LLTVLTVLASGAGAAGTDRERRCLALIAYAEAATEGSGGMLAVMKLIHNRIAHPGFAYDACAVALEPGQFQPVGERPVLRRALADLAGHSLAEAVGATTAKARLRLVAAWRLAAAAAVWPARDPTGGALYFVNPRLMNPGKCPWFAKLRRTAIIGQHVFMRHYAPGERKQGPALDCARAGRGYARAPAHLAGR